MLLPGLRNSYGEFNCFLNSVLQCLWQCRQFRNGLLSLKAQDVQVR
jgi:ubiquitin C-terminal hydrolase